MTGRLVVKGGRYYIVISYQDSQGKISKMEGNRFACEK